MTFLSQFYPGLYIFILQKLNMPTRQKHYMEVCKGYENDPVKYSLYIHGYIYPWLNNKRAEGKIEKGRYSLSF